MDQNTIILIVVAAISGLVGAIISSFVSIRIANNAQKKSIEQKRIDYLIHKKTSLEKVYYEFNLEYEGLKQTTDLTERWNQINDLYSSTLKRFKTIRHYLSDSKDRDNLDTYVMQVDDIKRIVSREIGKGNVAGINSLIDAEIPNGNEVYVNALYEFTIGFDQALKKELNNNTISIEQILIIPTLKQKS